METGDRTCRKLGHFPPEVLRKWLDLPGEHGPLIEADQTPEDLLWALRQRQLWRQSVQMIAYTLPEREAIWWSCMCVRHTVHAWDKPEQTAVEAAEAWVRHPEPVFQREAAIAASSCGCGAPGGFSALGVVWSHRKKFLPNLCGGRGAVNAVLNSAKRNGADHAEARLRRFIESGVDVGNGGAGRLAPEGAEA